MSVRSIACHNNLGRSRRDRSQPRWRSVGRSVCLARLASRRRSRDHRAARRGGMTGEKWRERERESPFVLSLFRASSARNVSCFTGAPTHGVQTTTTACTAGEIGERDGRCVRIETADITKTFLQKAIWCGGRIAGKWLFLLLGSQDPDSGFRKRHVADESQGEFPAMRWVLGKSVAYRKKPSIDMTVPLRNRGHRGQAGMVVVRIACWLSVSRKSRPTRM